MIKVVDDSHSASSTPRIKQVPEERKFPLKLLKEPFKYKYSMVDDDEHGVSSIQGNEEKKNEIDSTSALDDIGNIIVMKFGEDQCVDEKLIVLEFRLELISIAIILILSIQNKGPLFLCQSIRFHKFL